MVAVRDADAKSDSDEDELALLKNRPTYELELDSDEASSSEDEVGCRGRGRAVDEDDFAVVGDGSESDESSDDDGADRDMDDLDTEGAAIRRARQDVDTTAWGSKRSAYYQADYLDANVGDSSEEEELAAEEEAEAKRLQQQIAAQFRASDFMDDDEESSSDDERSKKQSKKRTKKGGKKESTEDQDEDADEDQDGVHEVEKDILQLSKAEQQQILEQDAPELLQLIADFRKSLEDIRSHVRPLMKRAKSGQVRTEQGISYLEVKYLLLLSYCTNIAFYLLLKAKGERVKDHPVIDQLVRLRIIIEKLRPLDAKLKYQIDKLLKLAITGVDEAHEADPLAYKPGLGNLAEDDESEDDDEGLDAADKAYRPPHLVEMEFDEHAGEKDERQRAKRDKRAAKSSIMRLVREEFGDEPEEMPTHGSAQIVDGADDSSDEDRTRYEEENFVRLPVTKDQRLKHRQRKQNLLNDELADLGDFGDVDLGDDVDEEEAEATLSKRRRTLGQYINDASQKKGRVEVGGDADLPYRERRFGGPSFAASRDSERGRGGRGGRGDSGRSGSRGGRGGGSRSGRGGGSRGGRGGRGGSRGGSHGGRGGGRGRRGGR